jgi:hypothetical protein
MGEMILFALASEDQRNGGDAWVETPTSVGKKGWSEFATSINTHVTSRKLTRRGCDQHQCQIGFPILCSCKHHKINTQNSHHIVPHRLEPI